MTSSRIDDEHFEDNPINRNAFKMCRLITLKVVGYFSTSNFDMKLQNFTFNFSLLW